MVTAHVTYESIVVLRSVPDILFNQKRISYIGLHSVELYYRLSFGGTLEGRLQCLV
jgi:hypothetical protein